MLIAIRVVTLALTVTTFGIAAFAEDKDNKEIVVTARSLKDTEADLRACIVRGCPPDQDVKATLAHAENQFVDGKYKDARSTLLSSLGRNRKHRDKYPVEVSDLLRANGNIAINLGEENSYRLSVLDMRDTLKSGLSKDDIRVFGAEIEVADSRLKLGYSDEAMDKYKALEKQALQRGWPQVAAITKIRQLSLLVSIAQSTKETARIKEASEALDAYIAKPISGAEKFTIGVEVLKSRFDRQLGRPDTTDTLIARYIALGNTGRPILIYANPIEVNTAKAARAKAGGSDLNRISTENVEKRWVDIGFWINSDGKVDEPEILRKEGSVEWTDVVLKSIRSRLYTPTSGAELGSDPAFYMVERYTMTANWTNDITGTHLRKRSPVTRIERIDLSADQ